MKQKHKTHSGTAKRVKISASGKVMRHHAGLSHLMPQTTQKQSRHLRKSAQVSTSDLKRIRHQIDNLM